MSNCTLCDGGMNGPPIRVADYTYARCSSCGSASLSGITPDDYYEADYFAGRKAGGYQAYSSDEKIHLKTSDRRLDALDINTRDAPSVVDVGSAFGYTLDRARHRGWEAVGVEISTHATGLAERKGHVVVPDLAAIDSELADGIVFGQVLEHMPDPGTHLEEAFRILKPGGRLFIETWDLESKTATRFGSRWQQLSPPSVLHLFTERGLQDALKRIRFQDVRIEKWAKQVGVGGYAGVVATKLPDSLGNALIKTMQATRADRLAIPYRFDDLISATATKPS